eukprot:11542511-Alexandrium_andersonii.AAC.1
MGSELIGTAGARWYYRVGTLIQHLLEQALKQAWQSGPEGGGPLSWLWKAQKSKLKAGRLKAESSEKAPKEPSAADPNSPTAPC